LAVPKLAVTGSPAAGSALEAATPLFAAGSVAHLPPRPSAAGAAKAQAGSSAAVRALAGGVVVSSFVNATVSLASSGLGVAAFRVGNRLAGDYTAWVSKPGGSGMPVRSGSVYAFGAYVEGLGPSPQTVTAQIDWRDAAGRVLATSAGRSLPSFGAESVFRRLVVSGSAPAGAVLAVPKLAVTGSPAAGSALEAATPLFAAGSVAHLPPLAVLSKAELSDYWNAYVAPIAATSSAQPMFLIGNLAAGDYTAKLTGARGARLPVRSGRRYSFRFSVRSAAGSRSSRDLAQAQIEWFDGAGDLIDTITGSWIAWDAGDARIHRLVIAGAAPRAAATAVPKIALSGDTVSGSSVEAASLRFGQGAGKGPGAVMGLTVPVPTGGLGAGGSQSPSPPTSAPATTTVPPFPGRVTQWRMAEHAVSGSVATRLFGNGLGTATLADNLGVHEQNLSPDAQAASYSDFGTLLVERGWSGVAIVGLFAAALAAAALRLLRVRRRGCWSTALTAAVPGAVCVMAAYGMIADQLRSRPAALTFWLVIALGLSPGGFLHGRPERGGGPARPWRHVLRRRDSRVRADARR
ncbi:MAG: hypothetical protein ACYDHH_19425, partial [Solirubrobacteraceae bacterium]